MIDISALTGLIGWLIYAAQAVVALWGAYCVVFIWRRLAELRFRSEAAQNEFLSAVGEACENGNQGHAQERCAADPRALSQLLGLAIQKRHLDFAKIRRIIEDRFRRDVLADLDHRVSWVNTVIRTSPMLGLFGTVMGMMGAFANLGGGENVDPSRLASDIYVALITTAVGLAIAIPLMICLASLNVRMRQLEDLVAAGLTHFFDSWPAWQAAPARERVPS